MVSTEVQRTLVKSPPELWAELSDAESLTRHLGELGQIRITRLEPESEVRWEAERASGRVQIKPSGWGTKVKLSVTHETPSAAIEAPAEPRQIALEQEPPAPARAPLVQQSAPAEPSRAAQQPAAPGDPPPAPQSAPGLGALLVQAPAPSIPVEPAPPPELAGEDADPQRCEQPAASEPSARAGLLARFFGAFRRRGAEAGGGDTLAQAGREADGREPLPQRPIEPPSQAASAIELLQARFAIAPATQAPAAPASPLQERSSSPALPSPSPAADCAPPAAPEDTAPAVAQEPPPAAGTPASRAISSEQLAELLSAMLDRLGAAHHRPFSRA